MNVKLEPEAFLLGMVAKQVERNHGILILYIISAARLYARRWAEEHIPRMEDRMEEWILEELSFQNPPE